jgi:ABC-2 type transport system ATP-binding protein
VAATLALYARLYPDPRPVGEVLDLVDLADEAQTRVGALSGGQRRRVDVAIAITGRPEVLFLDEPSAGLDPEARRHAWAGITQLTAAGTTVVLTTHYIEEADNLADRVLVLANGRIIADASPHELRTRGGASSVRFPLSDPGLAATLPPGLAGHLGPDERTVVVRDTDVAAVLRDLFAWADAHQVSMAGLEVGPPSLEDAYLAATSGSLRLETGSDD